MKEPVSKGSSSEIGYRVEARCEIMSHLHPVTLLDGIVTKEWREVHFERGPNHYGVPSGADEWWRYGHKHDLMPYESALAMAYTVLAQNATRGLELRLKQYTLETRHELTCNGVVDMKITGERYDAKLVVEEPPKVEAAIADTARSGVTDGLGL